VLIAITGLFLRLLYFPYDVPLFGDSHGYFWYAIDMSILNQLPSGHLVNNGWPSLLSIIFQLMDSNNFLDYQNVQRFVGVIFSVATIFPVYFLCSKYFKKSYSLLGATLFVFEPRLILNSYIGTPESMYIFLMALLLFLFLSNNFKKIYLAFAVVALLATTRYEGLLMIIPISTVFFIRFRKQKKDLIKYIICISIVLLILLPIAYFNVETMGPAMHPFGHVQQNAEYYQGQIQANNSTLADFIYLGSINLIKYFGWIQIPSFIIFIPLGMILIFKSIDHKKITIILSVLIMLIPAFYAYSREMEDTKYLYVLYPIFCVFACFTFKIFLEKFRRKNLIFCMIIGGIVLSSIIFVDWKAFDNEHYREAYEIFSDLSQKEMKVNAELLTYGTELMYFIWVPLQDIDEFPILEKELPASKVTILAKQNSLWDKQTKQWIRSEGLDKKEEKYYIPEIDNLRDYFHVRVGEQKITHLLLDENNNTPLINDELRFHLKDIFNHENKYPFLVKVYDSRENGFNYYVKLFKIDYDLYNEWINES
jgi:hypothetical protein